MSNTATEWTLDGFVEHFDFVHHKMLDHKFVWVLGAGTSYASMIPLGSELVDRWLAEMHKREDREKTSLEVWATAERLGMANFKFAERASFYTKVYQRRFWDYPEEGYAYLESVMSGKDPSPGYSILAAALAADPPRHNVVITTNFDNLVADALSIYTDTFPFVCGHESLTAFVRVAMRRPLICKIHRDLLLGPQNDPRSLRRLHDAWGTALRALFQHYTPLFIGYGGNDDTLMDLLESLQPGDIKGQMIWCYYEGGKPSERIVNVVTDLKGVLVPVPDFDLLMVLLGEKMGIGLLDDEVGRRARERTDRYRERIQRLDTVKHPSVMAALVATLQKSGSWWAWSRKAEAEQNPERRETVYRQGIELYPQSPELHSLFGDFMRDVRGNHEQAKRLNDKAEQLFRKALELDPNNANNTANFALFLTDVRGLHDEAEQLFRKALELDPNNANLAANFALFLTDVRGLHDEAERFYRKALELDPNNANLAGSFVLFLTNVRGLHDEAERFYRKALELDPNNANNTGNFAVFLTNVRGLHDEAEQLFRKALELDPKHANNTGNFALFLTNVRGLHDEAEQLFRKALELDPKHANNTGNFALFLTDVRGLHDEAEQLFRKALELDPNNANLAGSFALFLTDVRGLHDEAERFYRKALELDPNNANNTANYSEFLLKCGRLDEAAKKLERAKSLNDGKKNTLAAILAFYAAILARAEHKDDNAAMNELQTLFSNGFARTPWTFDQVLAFVKEKLSPQDHELFSVLAAAVLDPKKVPDATLRLRRRSATPAVRSEAKKAHRRLASRSTVSGSPRNGSEPEKSDGEGTLHSSAANSGQRKKSRRN